MARITTTGFEIPNYPDPFLYGSSDFSWGAGRYNGYALQLGPYGTLGNEVNRRADIPGAPTELYLRFAVYLSGTHSRFCQIGSPQTESLVAVFGARQTAITVRVNGILRITGDYIIPTGGEWTLVELHVLLGEEGLVELRINGIEEGFWEGNTIPNSDTGMSRLWLYSDHWASSRRFDDLAINDTSGSADNEWCGDGHVIAIRPNAAGDKAEWAASAGDNWDAVNDVTPDGDTTYVRSTNTGETDRYAMGDMTLPVGQQIRRVWNEVIARKEGAGTANTLLVGMKSGETEVWSDPLEVGTNYTLKRSAEHLINPDTGLPWTEADVNALLVGVKHAVME